MKQALKNKRQLEQQSGDNFRVKICRNEARRSVGKARCTGVLVPPLLSLSAGVLDPFQTLAVESSRLQALLGDSKTRVLAENYLTYAHLQ